MAFFNDMKTKKKTKEQIEKIDITTTEKLGTTVTNQSTSNPTEDMDILKAPSTTGQAFKITPFAGSFANVDFNTLRDKVNEIIDYINKQ